MVINAFFAYLLVGDLILIPILLAIIAPSILFYWLYLRRRYQPLKRDRPPAKSLLQAFRRRDLIHPTMRQEGISRPLYFIIGFIIASGFAQQPNDPAYFLFSGLIFIPLSMSRLRNIGISRWWSLLSIVPLANLWLHQICVFCPPLEPKPA